MAVLGLRGGHVERGVAVNRAEALAVIVPGGALFLLDVDPDSWRRSACSLAGRTLTDAERTAYVGAMELPAGCPP